MSKYYGMDKNTGKACSARAHLIQSINDILTTRIGTRVERRTYGSNIPDYIDATSNPATLSLLYGEVATTLLKWEPRLRLSRVQLFRIGGINSGQLQFKIDGEIIGDGQVELMVAV